MKTQCWPPQLFHLVAAQVKWENCHPRMSRSKVICPPYRFINLRAAFQQQKEAVARLQCEISGLYCLENSWKACKKIGRIRTNWQARHVPAVCSFPYYDCKHCTLDIRKELLRVSTNIVILSRGVLNGPGLCDCCSLPIQIVHCWPWRTAAKSSIYTPGLWCC